MWHLSLMGIAWAMGPIAWGYPMDCPWIGWMRADIVSWRSSKSKLNQKKIEEEEQTRGRDRWATRWQHRANGTTTSWRAGPWRSSLHTFPCVCLQVLQRPIDTSRGQGHGASVPVQC